MLHKYLQKVLNKLPKTKNSKDAFESNVMPSSRDIVFENEAPEHKTDKAESTRSLTERKEVTSFSPSKANLTKRGSIFMKRYSRENNKAFSTDLLEAKNRRIKELEMKLKDISALLYDLASTVRESLKLEDVKFRTLL